MIGEDKHREWKTGTLKQKFLANLDAIKAIDRSLHLSTPATLSTFMPTLSPIDGRDEHRFYVGIADLPDGGAGTQHWPCAACVLQAMTIQTVRV